MCQALASLPAVLLRDRDVSVLQTALLAELSPMPRLLNDHATGRSLSGPSSDIDMASFEVIGCLLRVLDSVILGSDPSQDGEILPPDDGTQFSDYLTSLCVVTEVLLTDPTLSERKIHVDGFVKDTYRTHQI